MLEMEYSGFGGHPQSRTIQSPASEEFTMPADAQVT